MEFEIRTEDKRNAFQVVYDGTDLEFVKNTGAPIMKIGPDKWTELKDLVAQLDPLDQSEDFVTIVFGRTTQLKVFYEEGNLKWVKINAPVASWTPNLWEEFKLRIDALVA